MRIWKWSTPIRVIRSTSSSTVTTINSSPACHATSRITGCWCSCAISTTWGQRRVQAKSLRQLLRATHRSDVRRLQALRTLDEIELYGGAFGGNKSLFQCLGAHRRLFGTAQEQIGHWLKSWLRAGQYSRPK